MPRKPKYSHHPATGQAYMTIGGRRIYLGRHGSPESYAKYARKLAELEATPSHQLDIPDEDLTIVELIAMYWDHAERYYVKNGKPTSELDVVHMAAKTLNSLYADTPAAKFGPRSLKALQTHLVAQGRTRYDVNKQTAHIRRLFKWAVSEELVPPSVHQGLITVSGLRKGKTAARETEPVRPVDHAVVERTVPHLPELVADMVRLQMLTGMRPGEVCSIRPGDVDRQGKVWLYVPGSHKNEHRGLERIVFIGPKAQQVLTPYLLRPAGMFCFSPAESEAKRREAASRRRKTPRSCGNRTGTNRRARPKRKPRDAYDTTSYRRAIHRACDKAFPAPEGTEGEALQRWRDDNRWSPNQLRHTAATDLRRKYGMEAARIVLGHADADMTAIYAERDMAVGVKIAEEYG